MLDIPSVSAIVAAVGAIAGVVFVILELGNLGKKRQIDRTMWLCASAYNKTKFFSILNF